MRARAAEAEEWERAAFMCAHMFWVWGIIAFLVWRAWGWWALIPGAFSLFRAVNAVASTLIAKRLREPPVHAREADVAGNDAESEQSVPRLTAPEANPE